MPSHIPQDRAARVAAGRKLLHRPHAPSQFSRLAIRLGIPGLILFCLVAPVRAQSVASVESSPQMFAVLCALQTAGYEADVDTATLNPVRAKLRPELLAKTGPAVDQLRAFYKDHELAESGDTLARYVSFALVVGPAPNFDFTVPHEQLPPDVLTLEGFNEVLAAYYREAGIEKLWSLVEPYYARAGKALEREVADNVFVSAGYLREILEPNPRHTLVVYVEPMVGSRTNFRNYGGRYALVVDPGREIAVDEIRHSFLHFMLDYLPLRHRAPLAGRKPLLDVAARAPRLSPELREDFTALLTECLVKAVEVRVRHLPAEKARAAVDQAEADGFVLERAIYSALDRYDKSDFPMRDYYPKLLAGLNFDAEAKRLSSFQFAAASEGATQTIAHPATPPERSELDIWLAEGEQLLAAQDKAAVATFERILEKYPDVPRAQYGLAVASVIRGDGERAKSLLQKVIQKLSAGGALETPEANTLAWAHVWLARIYDVEERRDLAVPEYRAALGVEGAPQAAKSAAQRGLEKP